MKYLILLLSLSLFSFSNPVDENKEENTKPNKEKIEIKNTYEKNKDIPKVRNKSLKDFDINISGKVRYRYEF